MVFLGQLDAVPFSEGLAVGAEIDSYIIDGTADGTHKLALRELFLEMQAAQHTLRGAGLIVLHELHRESGLLHVILIICFYKIAAGIAVNGRCDDTQTLDTADILFYLNLSHNIYHC